MHTILVRITLKRTILVRNILLCTILVRIELVRIILLRTTAYHVFLVQVIAGVDQSPQAGQVTVFGSNVHAVVVAYAAIITDLLLAV